MAEHEIQANWTTWDGDRTEHLTVRWENGGWTLDGRIVAVAPPTSGAAAHQDLHYVVRTDAAWHVRQFLLFRDDEDPDLWLATAGDGEWGEVNGATRIDLYGCTSIHLDDTPIGHTLSVRASGHVVGVAGDSLVAHVDAETLTVRVVRRRTTRVDERTWRFADVSGDDVGDGRATNGDATSGDATHAGGTEVDVDEHGLVLDHPGRFRRQP